MNSNSHLISFLVPTCNRPKALGCMLSFVTERFDGPIIIIDSSEDELANANVQAIENLKAPAIHYEKLPVDTWVPGKFILANKLAKTKYSIFCADDDFIVPEAVVEAAHYMEENPDVAAVNGRGLMFRIHPPAKFMIENYRQRPVSGPSWLDRLNRFARPYSTNFYSVQRTDALLAVLEMLESFGIAMRFNELFHAIATVIRGNVHQLDRLFLIRGTNEPSRASSTSEKFWNYIFKPEFSTEINKFTTGLITYTENLHGSMDEQSQNDLKKVISDLLAINYLCSGADQHPYCAQEDESIEQNGWIERLKDASHPDSALYQNAADRYIKLYA